MHATTTIYVLGKKLGKFCYTHNAKIFTTP
jgi:hypothetical protein